MRFETRDVQNRVEKMKFEKKSKSENDYVLLTHSSRLYIKNFRFLTKNRFLNFLFSTYQMHIKNRVTYDQ